MSRRIVVALLAALAASASANAAVTEQPFAFDIAQLSGIWTDNFSTEPACSMKSPHFWFEFSPDRKRVAIIFDRELKTPLPGSKPRYEADILAATERTLTIRYVNETRQNGMGAPIEWQLAIVSPGVYRWHVTAAAPGEVNTVVGIKCGDR